MKYIRQLIVIFFLLFTVLSFAQLTDLDKVKVQFDVENYKGVVELADQLDSTMSDSLIYFGGLSSYYIGDFGSAKMKLNRLSEDQGPLRKKIISTLAKIYEYESNKGKAIKFYKLLLEIDSSSSIIWRNYGHLCRQSSWKLEAVMAYEKSLKLNPNEIQSIYGLVEIHIDNDSVLNAYDLIIKTLENNYENPKSLNYGGRLSYWLQEYDQTIQYLKSHEMLTGLNYRQQKILGQAYLRIDSFDLAIIYLRSSLNEEKDPEFTFYNLGLCYLHKNEPDVAIKFWDKAVKESISPNIDVYLKSLGNAAHSLGQTKNSLEYYKKCYDILSDTESLFQLAKLSESYYADKKIALNYFKNFLRSKEGKADQIKYAQFMVEKINAERHQANVK